MPSAIKINDILWTRNGDPVLVNKVDDKTGAVNLERDFAKIQGVASKGIKNGLEVQQRDAYTNSLADVHDENKKQEIRNLYEKIKSLKAANADSRVIKYLENEFQFKMIKDNYVPENYANNLISLDI